MRSILKDILAVGLVFCLLFGAVWAVSAGDDRAVQKSVFAADTESTSDENDTTCYMDDWERLVYERTKYYEEIMAKRNDFPHPYLAGVFEENGEVTITGLKYARVWYEDILDNYYDWYVVKVPDLVIPDEIDGHPVTKIADRAFSYTPHVDDQPSGQPHMRSVVIGNNVRSIGLCAFNDQDGLKSLTIGKNVETIGEVAFSDCDQLERITDWGENLKSIERGAFHSAVSASGLTMPPFPDSLENIGEKAFAFSNLQSKIVIPQSVKTIASDAFWGSTTVTDLVLLNEAIEVEPAEGYPKLSNHEIDLYCYKDSTAEDLAKLSGYTYYLIDGASLLFDGAAVEGDALRLPTALTEAQFLARAATDGEDCEIRLSGLRDGKVTNGTTVTLWNTKVDAAGKVYTVRKDAEVETVSVSALPAKTSYRYKEAFDPTGLALAVTYDDGTTATVSDGFTLQGADNLKVGTNTVTAAYADRAATFDVTVKYTWWQYLIRIFLLGFLWY